MVFKIHNSNFRNIDENTRFLERFKNHLFSKQDVNKDWIKNSLGEVISKENIESYINKLDIDSAKSILKNIFAWEKMIQNSNNTWEEYFNTCKNGKEYIIDLIKNTDNLSMLTSEDLVNANQAARDSAIAHNEAIKAQTLSAKANQAAFQALATAGNMLLMWGISQVIQSAVTAIDKYVNRLEYAKEALSNTQSELASISQQLEENSAKIKELASLDPLSLSLTDKEDLQRLKEENEELRIRQQYLMMQKQQELQEVAAHTKEKYAQKYGIINQDTLDRFQGIYEGKGIEIPISYGSNLSSQYAAIQQNTEAYIRQSDALPNLIAQYKSYLGLKKQAVQEHNAKDIEQYNAKLGELSQKLAEGRTELQIFSDDLSATGENSPELESIQFTLQAIDQLLLSPGQNLANFIRSDLLTEKKEKLLELADAGTLTQRELCRHFSEINTYLMENGLTLQDLLSVLQSYQEELNRPLEQTSFDFSHYQELTDNVQSSVSALRSALDSLYTGNISESMLLDLVQQFPELVPYIDIAADGFGHLLEGLNTLIAQQPETLIHHLQKLKASLSTKEEYAQVELLIDSLQRLTSYRDSGMDAYAYTLDSTWNDTANVIAGVTSQFENLAKVQEAVAGGFTLSAAAATELAQIYPEILSQAQISADGQITLNENVVNDILSGDESIIDGQIAKLEADKAVLTAKKEFAEAQLSIAKQVGEGEGQITTEVANHRLKAASILLQELIDKGIQEDQAYSTVCYDMANNTDEFNRVVALVAQDSSTNMNSAGFSMAKNLAENSVHMQHSLENIKKKAWDVADAVHSAPSGKKLGSSIIYGGGGATEGIPIKIQKHSADFQTTLTEYTPEPFDLKAFQSQLEIDIKGYMNAISHIDSQIGVLKDLKTTFQNNGGAGGHGYSEQLKKKQQEKESANASTNPTRQGASDSSHDSGDSPSSDSQKDSFHKQIDFFERRIEVLNQAYETLEQGMKNLAGADAKKNLLSAQTNILKEELSHYTDALTMYQQKAGEALSSLAPDLRDAVQNGAVQIADFTGSQSEAALEAMEAYKGWEKQVASCTQKLQELKAQLRQLELQKFKDITEDFSAQFDLYGDSISLIKKQIGLLEESGSFTGKSYYTGLKDLTSKQLDTLQAEQSRLTAQLQESLASGLLQKGTAEWREMVQSLSDVEGSILDCRTALEGFDNQLAELDQKTFSHVQSAYSNLSSEMKHLAGLFEDLNDSHVSDEDGAWTKNALAALGLYAQQYELARYQSAQYGSAIDRLKQQYLAGTYSAAEYMERLADLSEQQRNAADAAQSFKDAIYKLQETRVEEKIRSIEEETDAYHKLIDAQAQTLDAEKDLHDYRNSLSEKTKNLAAIERQLAAMQHDDSALAAAQRKKLEEQQAEARRELEEAEYSHSIETQKEALNQQYQAYEDERHTEIEALRLTLQEKDQLLAASLESVKANASLIGQEILLMAQEHGILVSDSLLSAWQAGENAVAGYGEALTVQSSAFIGSLCGIEAYVYGLQETADTTAASLSQMFCTRAEQLVQELARSYYSEENLNAMTNVLQSSLTQMLEGGYQTGGIQSALSSVASETDRVTRSAREAAEALRQVGLEQSQASSSLPASRPAGTDSGTKTEPAKKNSGSAGGLVERNPKPTMHLFARGGIVEKDESNPLNAVAEQAGEDTMIAVKRGEGILTEVQTQALLELAPYLERMTMPGYREANAALATPQPTSDVVGLRYTQELTQAAKPNVTLHYDKMFEFNGDFNDSDHLIQKMETVSQKCTTRILDEINRDFRYGR